MVTKTGKEPEVGQTPELPEKETPPEVQIKTFTQEEIDALVEAARKQELEKYQNIQRTIAKKDKELETLRQQVQQPKATSDDSVLETMLQALKAKGGEYSQDDPMIAVLEKEIVNRKEQSRKEKLWSQAQNIKNEWREKIRNQIVEAGLDPDDDAFVDVDLGLNHEFYGDGRFDLIEKKTRNIIKSLPKKEKPEGKTMAETEEQKVEKIANEKYQAMLKAKGLTFSDTVTPSGSSMGIPTDIEKFKEWIATIPQEEYEAKYAAEVNKMRRQSRIK